MFVYCDNNPVSYADKNGDWFYYLKELKAYLKNTKKLSKKKKENLQSLYDYSLENYKHNTEILKNYREERNAEGYYYEPSYISAQDSEPWEKMYFGRCIGGDDKYIYKIGCGPVCFYNLYRFLGKNKSFPRVIAEMEINKLNGEDGKGGTDITKITDFFENHKIKFKTYKSIKKVEDRIKKFKAIVICVKFDVKLNEEVRDGSHIMFAKVKKNGAVHVYNVDTTTKKIFKYKSFEKFMRANEFRLWKAYLIR